MMRPFYLHILRPNKQFRLPPRVVHASRLDQLFTFFLAGVISNMAIATTNTSRVNSYISHISTFQDRFGIRHQIVFVLKCGMYMNLKH